MATTYQPSSARAAEAWTPAFEDVIQLALSVSGCRKWETGPVISENFPKIRGNAPTTSWSARSPTVEIGQKFSTIFWQADWITSSFAGVTEFFGGGIGPPSTNESYECI
jgi:hypothetical protein